jgi:hypothetical protein
MVKGPIQEKSVIIKGMPLCNGGSNDILIWLGNTFGQFSFKSAYVMVCAEYSWSVLCNP